MNSSNEHPPTTPANLCSRPVDSTWFCVRERGRAMQEGWIPDARLDDLRRQIRATDNSTIEVCVADDFRPVAPDRFNRVFCNRARGLFGMEIVYRGETVRIAPTQMLAANRGFDQALERFLEERESSSADFAADGRLRVFSARQYLLPGKGNGGATELHRGTTLVHPSQAAGEDRTADLAGSIGRWMVRNQSSDGSLPYKYWPSRGRESRADNAIRRFLATLSLARLGALRGDPEIREAAQRNLRFNMARYFQNIGGGRGAIVEPTGAKLGAAALAALAILESPSAAEFGAELALLAHGISSLAEGENGFRTFFFPRERNGDNWNFYSGEALLFWAETRRRGLTCAPTLGRFTRTFARCRSRHRQARNPAFVPWHTQACVSMFLQTGRREFADFALEINDWLLPMQQWGEVPPDMWGRFYDPRRPKFGPPHAASTGAYLEGLADALALARALGDGARIAAYERTIERGLRSLRQLQFRDSRDAFYISRKKRVMGALRTRVYDNTLRIDSAAHALAATVKLLRMRQSIGGRT